ncbi:TRAP transporter small permease [Desulfococcaceae bacterium HSG8]|nr:TRAP transporter small permease [Desulfococcaceae bacterium HSG8]
MTDFTLHASSFTLHASGNLMNTFWKNAEWILNKMKAVGAICLMGMTFLTCADVVGRFLGYPIFGSVEIVGFMATVTVAMALPYTHQVKGHIGVELLTRLFSLRTQAIIDVCTGIFGMGLFGIITWRMGVYAHTIQKSGEVSMNLSFPEYIIIYIVSFCFLIFFLFIIRDIIENIGKIIRGNE